MECDVRHTAAGAAGDQLGLLKQMHAGQAEYAEALAQAYQVEDDGVWVGAEAVCAGCPVCRAESHDRTGYTLPRPSAPPLPPHEPNPRLRTAVGGSEDAVAAVVTYPPPGRGARERRRWGDLVLRVLLPRMIELGVREVGASEAWASRT